MMMSDKVQVTAATRACVEHGGDHLREAMSTAANTRNGRLADLGPVLWTAHED